MTRQRDFKIMLNCPFCLLTRQQPGDEAMNTKAKHAPGPWGVYPEGVNHYVVWDEDDNFHVGDESMRQATARLIAAAPDLLAALKETVLAFGQGPESNAYWRGRADEHAETGESSASMMAEVLELARAALAKATGEA